MGGVDAVPGGTEGGGVVTADKGAEIGSGIGVIGGTAGSGVAGGVSGILAEAGGKFVVTFCLLWRGARRRGATTAAGRRRGATGAVGGTVGAAGGTSDPSPPSCCIGDSGSRGEAGMGERGGTSTLIGSAAAREEEKGRGVGGGNGGSGGAGG